MKIELHLAEDRPDKAEAEDAARSADSHEIITMSTCPKHGLSLIIVQNPEVQFDMACAMQACFEMVHVLTRFNQDLVHKRASRN